MKQSTIFSLGLLIATITGMAYTNAVLKNEYQKIDLNDTFKNYITYTAIEYSVLDIKGSNGYPIEIKSSNVNEIKVLRSRKNHFTKKLVGDTLFIEFSGSNISNEQAFSNETPPGIIIESSGIQKIITSNTFNRIMNFSSVDLEIELYHSSIADFSNCNLGILYLQSNNKSQFVFSENNRTDSLQLTMAGTSIGNLKEIEFSSMNHALEDSVILVLSKNTFTSILE